MGSLLGEIESLRLECNEWWELVCKLSRLLGPSPQQQVLLEIIDKFVAVTSEWEGFCEGIYTKSSELKSKSQWLASRAKVRPTDRQTFKLCRLLENRDMRLEEQYKDWLRCLQKMSHLWKQSLQQMKMRKKPRFKIPVIEKEVIPSLDLARVNRPKESDLLSVRSPFSNCSSYRSNSKRPHMYRRSRPLPPISSEDGDEKENNEQKQAREALKQAELLEIRNISPIIKLTEQTNRPNENSLALTPPKDYSNFCGELQQTIVSSEHPLSARDKHFHEILDTSN